MGSFKRNVERVFYPLKSKADKEAFDEAERERFRRVEGFIPLKGSKLLCYGYGKENKSIHLHIAPAGSMNMYEVMKDVQGGFVSLADVVNKDSRVQEVRGTSWIIGIYPERYLMRHLKFDRIEDIPEELKKKHFPKEKRPVKRAVMSRETLLKYFLKIQES